MTTICRSGALTAICSHIKVAIYETVNSLADIRSNGIVYGGVTNGARQANRFQRSAIVEKSFMRGLQPSAVSYGVPDGPPAICQANASGDDAVRSIAGSTVE